MLNYKEHKCEVCGKEFIKNQVWCPKCPDCYKKHYVKKCKDCGKLMTAYECQNGFYSFCQPCFAKKIYGQNKKEQNP